MDENVDTRRVSARDVAQAFDVPPWLIDTQHRRPRFARIRWALRRVWPLQRQIKVRVSRRRERA